jgi:hypothetical protein
MKDTLPPQPWFGYEKPIKQEFEYEVISRENVDSGNIIYEDDKIRKILVKEYCRIDDEDYFWIITQNKIPFDDKDFEEKLDKYNKQKLVYETKLKAWKKLKRERDKQYLAERLKETEEREKAQYEILKKKFEK